MHHAPAAAHAFFTHVNPVQPWALMYQACHRQLSQLLPLLEAFLTMGAGGKEVKWPLPSWTTQWAQAVVHIEPNVIITCCSHTLFIDWRILETDGYYGETEYFFERQRDAALWALVYLGTDAACAVIGRYAEQLLRGSTRTAPLKALAQIGTPTAYTELQRIADATTNKTAQKTLARLLARQRQQVSPVEQ